MKMARATNKDLDAALLLRGILCDVFDDRSFPRGLDGEFDPERSEFDEEDYDDLRVLYTRLEAVMKQGGLTRVIGGMCVLCDPENKVIDPDKDFLAPYPAEPEHLKRGPKIVCLCGSTRFYKEFTAANYEETMAGRIVLSVGFYPHAVNEMHGEGVGITADQKKALDELHLRKIDLADEVLILNVGGYIGESTARELAYARERGKAVRFLCDKEGQGDE